MTQVKICGIGRLDQALSAAQAGADYVGLVFVPERRRRITPAAAREIVVGLRQAGPNPPKVVGLFAAQPLAEVAQTATGCGLDLAQLCGGESLDYCDQLRSQAGVNIIRVVHVPANAAQDTASLSRRPSRNSRLKVTWLPWTARLTGSRAAPASLSTGTRQPSLPARALISSSLAA